MADRICSVDGCDGSLYARSFCKRCYDRERRALRLETTPTMRGVPPLERLLAKRRIVGDCWEYTGDLRGGYGRLGMGRRAVTAHRLAYEILIGPIPEGMVLDHLCRNRACFNPAHLEPVTQPENIRRGESFSAINRRKTHCPQGHPYDEVNTYVNDGRRFCRTCARELDRRRRRR